jgi:hypothetical protein
VAAGAALRAPVAVAVAVLASAAALAVIHLSRARVSDRGRRVLADFVLLSPLPAAVWL